jgi:glutathione S-transferase
MLTVHHLGISQSDRIVWLCEELEIPYKLEKYDRDPVSRLAPPRYKALHPFGTAPVITDGDLVLGESGAIIQYLIHKYGGGRLAVAPDKPNYPDYLYWFNFANASMMASSMNRMLVEYFGGGKEDDAMIQSVKGREAKAFDMVEKRLKVADYFAGSEFTAADLIMFFPLTVMRMFVPHDVSSSPNTRAYLQRVGNRPAYRRAMAKGDPDLPLNLE